MASNTQSSAEGKFSIGAQFVETPAGEDKSSPPVTSAVPPVTPSVVPATVPPVTQSVEENDKGSKPDPRALFLGGVRFDENGNLLDETGKIKLIAALAKRELENYKEPESQKKDDETPIEVKLSEAGDLVDAEGNIVYKKDEFKLNEKGEVELIEQRVIDILVGKASELGFTFQNEKGEKIEFEDTADGMFEFAGNVANQFFVEQQRKFFESYPEVLALAQHLETGGLAEDFYKSRNDFVDYGKLDIPKEQESKRLEVVRQYLTKVANNTPELTETMLNFIKDSGEVDKHYESSLKSLKDWQQSQEAARTKSVSEKLKADAEAKKKYWQDVSNIISKNEIPDITIPKAEQSEFFSYLSTPVKDGMPQRDVEYNNLSSAEKLKFDYLLFKKLKPAALAAVAKATKDAEAALTRSKAKPIIISRPPETKQGGTNGKITIGSQFVDN